MCSLVAVDTPGLKGSWGEVETWNHVVASEFRRDPGEALGEATTQLQRSQYFGDASTVGQSPRTAAAMVWSWSELRRQAV